MLRRPLTVLSGAPESPVTHGEPIPPGGHVVLCFLMPEMFNISQYMEPLKVSFIICIYMIIYVYTFLSKLNAIEF